MNNTPSPAEPPVIYIGFWKRVLASLVDTIFICAIAFPSLIAIYGWGYFTSEESRLIAGPADFFLSYILPIIICIGFWMWMQATPGKMLVRSIIVDAHTGGKPTTRQCIIRYLGYYVSLIPLGLGFLWVAFDKRKQGWHDKLAGTVVIRGEAQSVQTP